MGTLQEETRQSQKLGELGGKNRPFAARPARDIFFIKLWAIRKANIIKCNV